MMKLRKLELAGFRGALGPLVLDLSSACRSVAIFGENAAGKSTITDGVEWYYSDRINHLWREYCMESSLRNALLPDTQNAWVKVTLNQPGMESTKSLRPDLKSEHSNKTPEFRTYVAAIAASQDRIALRNADLLAFILKRKGDKRQELARIVGYEALDSFRSVVQQAQSRLEKDAKYVAAKQNYPTLQNEILQLSGTMIATESDLWKSASDLASKTGFPLQIADDSSYTASIQSLRVQLTKQEKGQQKLKLSQTKQQLERIPQSIGAAVTAYADFIRAYSKLLASEATIRQIMLLGLLTDGKAVIEQRLFELDRCPLCLQTKDYAALLEELESRIAKLEEAKSLQDDAIRQRGFALAALSNARQAVKDAADKLTDSGFSTSLTEDFKKCAASLDAAAHDINDHSDSYQPVKSDIETETHALSEALPGEISRLTGQIKDLEISQQERGVIDLIQVLENLRTSFNKLIDATKIKGAYERQIKTLDAIRSKFSTIHSNTLQQALDVMSDHIGKFYLTMHPNERVDGIKLEILEEGVEFKYLFHGKPAFPPAKYLSESHLNSLGIAAFLASAELFNKSNHFFVLDDVVTSFDAGHRLRLLRLLKQEFADWQILLLTHEPVWFEFIKKEMPGAGWLIHEVEMIEGVGIQLKTPARDMKHALAQKKAAGNLVPNDVRTLLEKILKEICYALEVKVAFRFNDENERRMPGELVSQLRSKLNKRCPAVKDDPTFGKIETSSLIGTIGSHDSGPVLSLSDLAVALEDVMALDGLFCCQQCETYLAIERYVTHEKKLYCKCGSKSLAWKD
jgi:hypothetical protein